MTRALVIIRNQADRTKVAKWAAGVPLGSRVEFKETKRSVPQNARLWAMLTDISQQVKWHGVKLSPDDFKLMFMDGLKREARMVPNIDGNGFVNLGRSSSDLSKSEFSDLFELMEMFAANHGVEFSERAAA